MSKIQTAFNVILVLAILAIGGVAFRASAHAAGGANTYESYPVWFGNGAKLGQQGTTIANAIVATCNAATTQLPLEATSSDDFYCPVTGAMAGDKIEVMLPSNSGSPAGGFLVDYAAATTTGVIGFGLTNLTGNATSSFPLATTSVTVIDFR